ncbi:RsmB/NOP family class I SAM-dependent RNA methyltransferase [Inmirania thermothiophila]|uniref:NOL1/NOP2/sun family putative RNA methylase n=1 Tax=Inmirania thermothiophila TaxID=1750597 RepID=A0A3N1Y895_9GAMM|nr:RsmB/NOP family class I SAM-dependent RNA methyltransferase [Inmirania thermothiophila]ROR35034.1 NOL1/NOP2/sun family putative RNA methylase [Inmirania thermothiophila]
MRGRGDSAGRRRAAFAALARYRELIDDWAAFVEALERPLPRCVWANPLRIDAAGLARLLAAEGVEAHPLAWHPGAFRLAAADGVGARWWYLAGLAHAQEEASLLPVRLLDPQPGERILDLCAAPGGKTAQIALALGNRGTVVANDVHFGRLRPLRASVERLGLLNVSLTVHDGTGYPGEAGPFHRVLVDAPCSGEGTLRKHAALEGEVGEALSRRYARRQRALLRRAVQLTRPGGRIVYSTCTFAPEENEEVVDAVLREAEGRLRIVPARVHGLRLAPGVTRWAGRDLDPALAGAARLWPHHNDTGGFFVAVLERTDGPAPAEAATAAPDALDEPLVRALLARHGVPEAAAAGWRITGRSGRGVHVAAADHVPPPRPAPEATGLPLVNLRARPPKATTAAALLLAAQATRNVVDLEAAELAAYLARAAVTLPAARTAACDGGFVLVRHRGFGLGTALLRPDGTLESLFPKRWAVPT